MKVIHKSNVIIYEPKEVFAKCIKKYGDSLKEYMYMHSDNENTHHFKNIITREYIMVSI